MKYAIVILIAILWTNFLFAQDLDGKPEGKTAIKGKITGIVIDSTSRQPVEFATIMLVNAQSQEQIDGLTTDEKGEFKFVEVPLGKYQMVISFIGYRSKTVDNVVLSPEKPDYNTNTIYFSPESYTLEGVEIVAEASIVENKIDKMVYNAEKDVSTMGGDASDVLARVPMLSVDVNGGVSLRGSSNIQILINGRPSAIFSGGVAEALKSIPAEQIKSIEVITSPSARYDGEGSAGIINIITRKKSPQGFTGNVSASVGTRSNNGNVGLNYAKGRFGLSFSGGYRGNPSRPSISEFERRDFLDTGVRTLTQNGQGDSRNSGGRGNLELSYDINAYNRISTNVNFGSRGRNNYNLTNALFIDPAANVRQEYTRQSYGNSESNGLDWSFDYRRTFAKPDRELTFAVQLENDRDQVDNLVQQNGNDPSLERNERNGNRARNAETLVQLDYVHPFGKKVKFETGVKGVFRNIYSDFDYRNFDPLTQTFVLDELRSDQFDYGQDVYAGYGSFNIELSDRWGLLAGARYEGTSINGDYDNPERQPFNFNYSNVLPSTTLNYKLSKLSNLKLSFGQRIQRPDEDFVNPYVAVTDPRDITVGNPLLLPEVTNQYELTFSTAAKGFNMNFGTFYRATRDIIEPILSIIDDGVSLTSYQNIGKSSTLGANLFSSVTIKDKLQLRGNATVIYYTGEGLVNGVRLSNSGAYWNGNMNVSYTFSKTLRAEVNGFYSAPRVSLQGSRAAFARSSFAIRKDIWKKKASIGVVAVQPFAKYLKFPNQLKGTNFEQFSQNAVAQRSYGISFIYRFGKLDFKERKDNGRDEGRDGRDEGF